METNNITGYICMIAMIFSEPPIYTMFVKPPSIDPLFLKIQLNTKLYFNFKDAIGATFLWHLQLILPPSTEREKSGHPPSELDSTLCKAGLENKLGNNVVRAVEKNLPDKASETGALNEEASEKGEVDDNDTGTEFDGNGWQPQYQVPATL